MLVLNTSESSAGTFALSEYIAGDWELIHQWVDYHEPYAVNYTCNRLWSTYSDVKSYDDLADQIEMSAETLASDLDSSTPMGVTVTALASGEGINIAVIASPLEIHWTESSARLLFKNVGADETIAAGTNKDFLFRDREVIKHYSIDFDQCYDSMVTTNDSKPTIIISAYDGVVSDQQLTFALAVNELTFTVREYGSLVDLLPADIPDIHLIFKKIPGT